MSEISWFLVGSAAAALTTFGFVPQVLKIWRTKSVRDISPVTFLQFAAGVSLWAVYGVHLRDPIVLYANLIALSILITGLLLYFRFHKGVQQ